MMFLNFSSIKSITSLDNNLINNIINQRLIILSIFNMKWRPTAISLFVREEIRSLPLVSIDMLFLIKKSENKCKNSIGKTFSNTMLSGKYVLKGKSPCG